MDKLPANAPCGTDDDCPTDYCNPYPPAGVGRTCLPGLSFAPFAPTCDAYFGPSTTAGPDGGSGAPTRGGAGRQLNLQALLRLGEAFALPVPWLP